MNDFLTGLLGSDFYIFICLVAACALLFLFVLWPILRYVFKNPFVYPYFIIEFNVTNKKNVDIYDYVDRYLCDPGCWEEVLEHKKIIENWKSACENRIETAAFAFLREKQYNKVLDDENAYQFITYREQTRYMQRNYVKHAYKASVDETSVFFNWQELMERRAMLAGIGFEATLKEYHSKNQRKLMRPDLRQMIMERDNYTCQCCGKYMPDGVGLQIDHIKPISAGGKSVPSNLQVLCSKCNGRKGSRY